MKFLKRCFQNILLNLFFKFSDRISGTIKKEVDVKESEITSTIEDTCFVDIPEDEIKLENTEIQGNLNKFTFSYRIKAKYVLQGERVLMRTNRTL